MCSPVIFLSSNFIVQYEEFNLFSSEHNTELLWQAEVYTITGNTNREGVAPWPDGQADGNFITIFISPLLKLEKTFAS